MPLRNASRWIRHHYESTASGAKGDGRTEPIRSEL